MTAFLSPLSFTVPLPTLQEPRLSLNGTINHCSVIDPRILSRIYNHCAATYPFEACGLLLSPSQSLPLPNTSKNPRREFQVNPFDLQQCLRPYKDTHSVQGIYHSHVDLPAFFSDKDKQVALTGGDRPRTPTWVHLVVSVCGGESVVARAFRWSDEKSDFQCIWEHHP